MENNQTSLPPNRYLLAIDPGLATGVAWIDITDLNDPVALWAAEWSIPEFQQAIGPLMQTPNLVVAIEKFTITTETGKLGDNPTWSSELIGVVNYLGFLHNVPITIQLPSEKPFASNERLQKVGFWHVGENGHANDAYRHAMIWIVHNNRKWTKNLLM